MHIANKIRCSFASRENPHTRVCAIDKMSINKSTLWPLIGQRARRLDLSLSLLSGHEDNLSRENPRSSRYSCPIREIHFNQRDAIARLRRHDFLLSANCVCDCSRRDYASSQHEIRDDRVTTACDTIAANLLQSMTQSIFDTSIAASDVAFASAK